MNIMQLGMFPVSRSSLPHFVLLLRHSCWAWTPGMHKSNFQRMRQSLSQRTCKQKYHANTVSCVACVPVYSASRCSKLFLTQACCLFHANTTSLRSSKWTRSCSSTFGVPPTSSLTDCSSDVCGQQSFETATSSYQYILVRTAVPA